MKTSEFSIRTYPSSPPSLPPFPSGSSSGSISPMPSMRLAATGTALQHPFSASQKATQSPPLYWKKPPIQRRQPSDPPCSIGITVDSEREPQKRYAEEAHRARVDSKAEPTVEELEKSVWDSALAAAVDTSNGNIDLSHKSLTFIPPNISDLASLVIIPTAPTSNPNAPPSIPSSSTNAYLSAPKRVFTRVATAPASYNTTKTLTRSKTAAAGGLLFGQASKLASRVTDTSPRNGTIHLYLAVNHIKALPRELFSVKSLAVLSLRSNNLTYLPPLISELSNLQELNVANNKLTFLPAELDLLNLTLLSLHPNPFLPRNEPSISLGTPNTRYFGAIEHALPSPLPLAEVATRVLLSPAESLSEPLDKRDIKSSRSSVTVFNQLYDLSGINLGRDFIQPHLLQVIYAAGKPLPDSLSASLPDDASQTMTRSICPNPRHSDFSVFVKPAEQRLEWVVEVAGVTIAETDGGRVPILWRGCERGCLAFLEDEGEGDHAVDDEGGDGFDTSDWELNP